MKVDIDVPDGKQGPWTVETFEVSEAEAQWQNMRARFSFSDRGLFIKPGIYKRLRRNGTVVMSNTPSEIRDLWPLYMHRRGDVLLNGLGLGCALKLCLESQEVRTVTVVEVDADVIDLVGTHYTKNSRVKIVHADAFAYKPPRGRRFYACWHDIWDNITSENLNGMQRLHRKYGRICRWQGSWKHEECKRLR